MGNYIVEDPQAAELITTKQTGVDKAKKLTAGKISKSAVGIVSDVAKTSALNSRASSPWGVQGVHWGLLAKQ